MKLQDRLPDSITVLGKRYKLDLDFRNVLRMIDILEQDDLIHEARTYLALRCVMRRPPRKTGLIFAALRLMLFPAHKGEPGKRLTSFEQDADLIRAAFRQAYGIDLYRDKLHWMEFQTLLAALPEGSRYSEVLGIRAREMPAATKYNQAEREWLAKAKAACALEMSDDDRQRAYAEGVKSVFAGLLAWAEGSDGHV